MLNKMERFSLYGQANARGFLPYNPELKKEVNVYCLLLYLATKIRGGSFRDGSSC